MALFIHDDKSLKLDDSNLGLNEGPLIEKLWTLFKEHGYDLDSASTGVHPCPDFGYFELSDRFWRGALSIYFAGFCKAFIEAGVGFLEPWLFNSRHAIELSLKGCLLYATWYEELLKDSLASGYKAQLEKIENDHNLMSLYSKYDEKMDAVLQCWDIDEVGDIPELAKLLLSESSQKILEEISEADPSGFRFRYPSLKHAPKDHRLQEMSWQWDEASLFPLTGLPKQPGIAFTHVKVVNALHDLVRELSDIQSHHDAFYAYLDEIQGYAFEGL